MRSNRTYSIILVLPFIMLSHGTAATENSRLAASPSACNASVQPNPLGSLSPDCRDYIKHYFGQIISTKIMAKQPNLRDTKSKNKVPLSNFEQRAFSTRVGSYSELRHRSTTTQSCVLNHYETEFHISRLVDQLDYSAAVRVEKAALINQTLKENKIC